MTVYGFEDLSVRFSGIADTTPLRKIQTACSVAVCPQCGYVELYVDEPHHFLE